jgi:hypothetical protein
MLKEKQKRKLILNKIENLPSEKLNELDEFIVKLEQSISNKKKTLSFAGSWKDIDENIFATLTNELIERRRSNRVRINE